MTDNNLFTAIENEHDLMRTLLDSLAKTEGDSERRQSMFERFKTLHNNHAAAEERALYGRMLEDKEMREKAGHSIKEHKDAEKLIDELDEMDMSNPAWLPKLRELKHEVEHHLREEEEEVFQLADRKLTDAEEREMEGKFHDIRVGQA